MGLCVVGTGYVGLVTCAGLADLGNQVIGVDANPEKVAQLQRGEIPFYEPGLKELVDRHRDRNLSFTSDLKAGVERSEVIFIAVGTPVDEHGEADLSAVRAVASGIGRALNGAKLVVVKSTVPVGMGDLILGLIAEQNTRHFPVGVVSNPEFLREGSAVHDFLQPDRIVIGAERSEDADRLRELYQPLQAEVLVTNRRTAEMIKYASNAFLATKVSFINELARLCGAVGAEIGAVARGMGMDHRIGGAYLNAGLGFGGSCLPKDMRALVRAAEQNGQEARLLKAVLEVNQQQLLWLGQRLAALIGPLAGKTLAVLGLAFKPETDDLRESPALAATQQFLAQGARVQAYDPAAMPKARALLPGASFAQDAYAAAEGADALLVFTEWNEFKEMDLPRIKAKMRGSVLVDGRNLIDPIRAKTLGFTYCGVGRD